MSEKPLPPELLELRPALADDSSAWHPSNGVPLGPVPKRYSLGVHKMICDAIRGGNRSHVAAQLAGIPQSTFYSWMQKGRDGDPHLWQFAQDVELAEGEAEGLAVKTIVDGFKDNPDNAKYWLDRARAGGWNKSAAAIAQGQIEEFMRKLEAGLPPEIFQQVLSVAVGQQSTPKPLPVMVDVKLLDEQTDE